MTLSYKDFFGLKIWVGITLNEKSYLKEMKRIGIKDPGPYLLDNAMAVTHFLYPQTGNEKGKHIMIVCISNKLTKFGAYGLLVHEAVHVMQEIKEIMREEKIGREMEAYATQGVSCFLWNEYDELKKK